MSKMYFSEKVQVLYYWLGVKSLVRLEMSS